MARCVYLSNALAKSLSSFPMVMVSTNIPVCSSLKCLSPCSRNPCANCDCKYHPGTRSFVFQPFFLVAFRWDSLYSRQWVFKQGFIKRHKGLVTYLCRFLPSSTVLMLIYIFYVEKARRADSSEKVSPVGSSFRTWQLVLLVLFTTAVHISIFKVPKEVITG
jgi:hypothetical protein